MSKRYDETICPRCNGDRKVVVANYARWWWQAVQRWVDCGKCHGRGTVFIAKGPDR